MKRQTRLTPAEGGRFAGPVGSPVSPNAADMGLATDEQVDAANATLRRLDQMLEEHGCEMLANQAWYQWLIVKGDRVLMRVSRAQMQLARLEETRAIVEEVVRREAASAEDTLEMLDKARASENHTSMLLDVTRRERDELNEVVKALRAKMEELAIWKSHRLDCDQRAHDYDLDAGQCRHCHVQLSDPEWTLMREVTGRSPPRPGGFVEGELKRERAEQAARMMEEALCDCGVLPSTHVHHDEKNGGFITKQAEKRKEVGRLEDIAGGPSDIHGCLICDPCKECSCGHRLGGAQVKSATVDEFPFTKEVGRWAGIPVIADDSLPDGKIYAVPAGHEWKVLTPPKPTVVADPPFSYQQEFREAVRVLPAGRHLLEAGQRFVVDGNVLGPVMTTPQRGLWDVWVRNGSTCTALYEDKEG